MIHVIGVESRQNKLNSSALLIKATVRKITGNKPGSLLAVKILSTATNSNPSCESTALFDSSSAVALFYWNVCFNVILEN